MKFKRRLPEAGFTQIDFVSYINVAFLIIIFFLLSSKLVVTPGMAMKLPKLLSADQLGQRTLLVVIDSHNDIRIQGEPTSYEELSKVIKSGKYTSIFIQADTHVSLGIVGRVYQLCQALGIERIGLATTFDR